MMTGTVIGYNRIGSITSRVRDRTSMAANNVPTEAKPSVPRPRIAASMSGAREERRVKEERDHRHQQTLCRGQQHDDAQQLADVDGRPRRRREEQRAHVSPYRSRSKVRPSARLPANSTAIQRIPAAAPSTRLSFLDECERKHQHAPDGEKQRRGEDLAALHLNREVLPEHEEGRLEEAHAVPTIDR